MNPSLRFVFRLLSLLPASSIFLASQVLSEPTPPAEASLSGHYILWEKTVSVSKIPIIRDVIASTTSLVLLELQQQGRTLSGKGKLCSLKLYSSSSLVHTTFPTQFITALPPITFGATVEQRDGRPFLVSEPKTLVLGARLKHLLHDSLPRNSGDVRVYDQDADGHPGMTVHISGLVSGEVYLVQRSTTQLSGAQNQEGFAGGIHFELEQNVIGASTSVLKHGPNPQADSLKSSFVLRRTKAPLTCVEADDWARSQK